MRFLALLRRIFQAGRGRPAAVAMLAGLAALLHLPQWSPFHLGQLALFDRYQRVFPRERQSAPAVIVEIDEKSLKTLGQWPWPRDRLAALLENVAALKPAAIGLDIYMPEADGTSPEALAARLPDGAGALRKALRELPTQDQRLAEALRRVPTVLGAAGFDFETLTTSRGLRSVPLHVEGGDALPLVRQYPFVLASLPQLQAAAAGQALLSVDLEGGVVRRVPLVMAVGDALLPSLAMEMLRVATGSTAVEVSLGLAGIDSVRVADLTVPTQPNGEVWLHFGPALEERYVSAADVLAGEVPADRIEGKLVLVGLTGFGLMDTRTTPLKEHVPGIDIQAQLVESFFDGRFLLRPAWMPWVETALLLVGGLFLIWAVPSVKPRIATLLATILFVILFGVGFGLFRATGMLLDAASVFAALNIVFGSLLSSVFIEADRQRRLAEAALHRERESAARVAGELAAARRIQLGSLPRAETAFPGETRFEVAAVLEPAREVGGDLYDFFMLDDRHLFFVVGDVSGKGVPASLFMAVAKALGKSVALRGEAGIAEIVRCANEELSRENPEMLFVTMLAGILDADTGDLALCNAGHDAPWRRGRETEPQQLTGDGGPPLCVLEDFPYPAQQFRLRRGDSVFVITDGITEAMDGHGVLYGTDRFSAALAKAGPEEPPAALVARVREDVRQFVAGAEASDDLTLLVLRWTGPR
ncbi:MAG TPA: CHASE2 domain-containing protein [Rhodocyclaceae bacterium]|nr:CHASE2 domain-containing protein [Rhodocyclaceae bacterium]